MAKYTLLPIALFVILSGFLEKEDDKKTTGNQKAFYESSDPIDIDSNLFKPEQGKIYFHFNTDLAPTDLKKLDFIWLENNPKEYFTAYLVNTTDSTFTADRQDGSLIMIQEAQNEKGEWLPIEYWVYSGCGNSYFDPLELEPGKYVLVPIKKYSGNFKTKIRLKFKKDDTLFYSDSFDGSIDKSQFEKETGKVNGILYHGDANYLGK
ncbi:MAG: hypothetical protein QE487_01995 [Fluviicola sp.]|nr:hypothetical protein [Fluviicola sp.]